MEAPKRITVKVHKCQGFDRPTAYIRADLVEKLIERTVHRATCQYAFDAEKWEKIEDCTCGLDDLIREVRG